MVCKMATTDVSCGRLTCTVYVFGPGRTEGKRGLRRSLCKHAENLETCRKARELTLHDIFHACQVRKDLEIVLGSPALFHVGISRVRLLVPRRAAFPRCPGAAGRLLVEYRQVGSCEAESLSLRRRAGGRIRLLGWRGCAEDDRPGGPWTALWAAYRRSPVPFLSGLTALHDLSQRHLAAMTFASTFGS